MLANVQQATIKPVITAAVAPGTLVHTDEYSIYARLPAWGYGHKTVCHGRGEYARDEDGDGFCEVHVNTMEASGRCCAPGCDRTAASRRTSCRFISASSSSCITRADAAKPCSARLSPAWLRDEPTTTPEPNKSHVGLEFIHLTPVWPSATCWVAHLATTRYTVSAGGDSEVPDSQHTLWQP